MTILFDGTISVANGVQQRATTKIPANIKRPGIPLDIKLSFDGTAFPIADTLVEIGISCDDGVTFKTGGMTFSRLTGRFTTHTMIMSLGPNDVPTDAWFRTTAPSAFNLPTRLEAI